MTITEFLEARIAEDEATLDAVPAAAKQSDDYDFGGTDDYLRFTMGYGRALAECAAKRAIIDDYTGSPAAFQVLAHMAAIYSEHPDYQQGWAP